MGKYITLFDGRLKETQSKTYVREAYQSMLTTPEWMSVELSGNLAKGLNEKTSLFHLPYFQQTFELWRVLYNSLYFGIQESGFFKTIFSDYVVMDLFVVMFTTCELLPKGLLSLVLYPFLPKENDTAMQTHFAEYYQAFANELETTPFFQHDYKQNIHQLSEKWAHTTDWTWVDYFTWSVVWIDLRSKQFISSFLQGAYDDEPSSTQVLVKYNAVDITDPEQAIAEFKEKMSDINSVNIVGNDVYAKDAKSKNGQTYTSVYARINAPRYMGFKESVIDLAEQGIYVRKIAGQAHVMLKCEVEAANKIERKAYQARVLNQVSGITPLYEYGDGKNAGHALCLFKVPAEKLDKTIQQLEKESDEAETSVKFIHNF